MCVGGVCCYVHVHYLIILHHPPHSQTRAETSHHIIGRCCILSHTRAFQIQDPSFQSHLSLHRADHHPTASLPTSTRPPRSTDGFLLGSVQQPQGSGERESCFTACTCLLFNVANNPQEPMQVLNLTPPPPRLAPPSLSGPHRHSCLYSHNNISRKHSILTAVWGQRSSRSKSFLLVRKNYMYLLCTLSIIKNVLPVLYNHRHVFPGSSGYCSSWCKTLAVEWVEWVEGAGGGSCCPASLHSLSTRYIPSWRRWVRVQCALTPLCTLSLSNLCEY